MQGLNPTSCLLSAPTTLQKYDEWVEKMKGGGDVPWEQKEERAVGYWHGYCAYLPQADRFGRSEKCIRAAYVNQSALGTNLTAFSTGEREALSLQARFKVSVVRWHGAATCFHWLARHVPLTLLCRSTPSALMVWDVVGVSKSYWRQGRWVGVQTMQFH